MKQYSLLLVTYIGSLIDQYRSHHALLEGRSEAYVCGGGLCVMLCAGRLGAELVVFSGERIGGGAWLFLQPLDAGGILFDEVCPVLRGAR